MTSSTSYSSIAVPSGAVKAITENGGVLRIDMRRMMRSIIKERQREGIEKAKHQGRYTGRKATIDPSKVIVMRSQGMGATAIAKELGIGRASVYRILEAAGD